MQEPCFQRSVIYLIEHGETGSMGLVLNQKLGLLLNNLIDDFSFEQPIPLYLGGPVGVDSLFFIHSFGDRIPESVHVNGEISFAGNLEYLTYMLKSGATIEGNVKFFLGYSGWRENQLNEEIERNSWIVSELDATAILSSEDELWKSAVESLGGSYKLWLNYPKDPKMN